LEDAYAAGFLHHNFSPGNIIIDEHRKGWLIDWDLSKLVSCSSHPETPQQEAQMVRYHHRHT